jgi:uncharacterized protein
LVRGELAAMQFNYPFKIDGTGRTARIDGAAHVRQMIEQVLFTTIEERVNRPTFGTRINQLVFAPNSEELSATTRILVESALQQHPVGNLIKVMAVETKVENSTLHISIEYLLLADNDQPRIEQFSRKV